MRRLRLPIAVLCAAALAAIAAGCGGGGGGSAGGSTVTGEPISFEALAKAGRASAEATTGRFAFSLDMALPGATDSFEFSGEGAFDATAERASMTIDFSAFVKMLGGLFGGAPTGSNMPDFDDPDAWQIQVVQDGTVMYMHFPAFASELPGGKSWVRVDLRQAVKVAGFDFSQFADLTNTDPRQALDYLSALAGEIETVGVEKLRGVETTHYRATVNLLRYEELFSSDKREELGAMLEDFLEQAGIQELPVDIWIDEFGLVRQFALEFSATDPSSQQSVSASVTFELFDYGKDVAIDVPSPAEVVDASKLR